MSDATLTAAEKHVALTLSTHMDMTGEQAFPGMRLLASETHRKTGTVALALKTLETRGYLSIKRDKTPGVRKELNRYTAKCPQEHTSVGSQVSPSGTAKSAEGDTKLHKSYTARARKNGAPAGKPVCPNPQCGIGGGRHVDDCEFAT